MFLQVLFPLLLFISNSNVYSQVIMYPQQGGVGSSGGGGDMMLPMMMMLMKDGTSKSMLALVMMMGGGGGAYSNNDMMMALLMMKTLKLSDKSGGPRSAVCTFGGEGTGSISGTVTISQNSGSSDAIFILNLSGLTPGKHGFHVHQHGNL